jgi:hypothetical protein
MTALILLLASPAMAEPPLLIRVGDDVSHIELDCGGKKIREKVIDNIASFGIAPKECTVTLIKPSGVTEYNGTWACNEKGCALEVPPHRPISNAEGRVNFVLLSGVTATQLEMVCQGGYRKRASVVEHTVTFDDMPSETCIVHFKGGQPARFPTVNAGKSYKCSVTGTIAVCNDYPL